MDIRADLIKLKKVVRVFTEWVSVIPCPLLPIPSLIALMVDVDSLVPNFYTLNPNYDETDTEKVEGDLES